MTEVGIAVRERSGGATPLSLMEEEAATQGMQAVSRKVKGMNRAQPRTPPLDGMSLGGCTGWHEGPGGGVGQGAWPWPSFGNK